MKKVYEVREQLDKNPRPESRGYLVKTFATVGEACDYAERLDGQGRNVAVYTAWVQQNTEVLWS
jgi:hypothetical protein